MLKLFATLFIAWSLFFMPAASAAIETYTGTDDYTVGEHETQDEAQEHSKARALRNAQEQAGFYISTRSRALNLKLVDDEILVIAKNIVKIVGAPQYRKEILSDGKSVLLHTTIKVQIDTDELDRRLKDIHDPLPTHEYDNLPAKMEKKIPADAVRYNGHSYRIYSENFKTYEEAKSFCESLGGYLAIINDTAEDKFLFEYMKSAGFDIAYFGLTDAEHEGTWTWVDGTPLTYKNWGKSLNEPNGGIEENYAAYASWACPNGEWVDANFSLGSGLTFRYGDKFYKNIRTFICEWDN